MPSLTSTMRDLTGKVRKKDRYAFAHGGLADIWKGEWKQDSRKTVQVAVKLIRGTWNDTEYLTRLKRKLVREGTVWSGLQHPQITPFFGVCFDLDRPDVPSLVCPYYKNGDITTYLQTHPEADRLNLVTQVAAGLSYLHGLQPNPVIHGDIKASNILVNDRHEASLTDFGLSRILEYSGFTTKTVGGTCRWMAYELIAPREGDDNEEEYMPPLTAATDVWAFAMTVIEILTGRIPFCHIKYDTAVILAVIRGGLPSRRSCPEISDEMWSVLRPCWTRKPSSRPTMHLIGLILDISLSRSLSTADIHGIIEVVDKYSSSSRPHDPCISIDHELTLTEHSGRSWRYRNITLLPYPCLWPSCTDSFSSLSKCQSHEVQHFEDWKLGP